MRFYTTQTISPKREMTPEGFMLCRDVPIARTGVQIYGADELPLKAGRDGLIHVQRDADEVFRPETMASASGKPLVNNHPDDDVTPENWRQLSMGTVFNPRRGELLDEDLLLADILITDKEAIGLMEDGKRELSCGYDAQYEELEPGKARQYDIVINHVALVDKGRCGTRCSIGDHATCDCSTCQEKKQMAAKTVLLRGTTWDSFVSKLRDAFKTKDSEAMEAALAAAPTRDAEEGGEGTHIHMHMPGGTGGASTEGPIAEDEAPAWFAKHAEASDKRFGDLETGMGALGETLKGLSKANDAEKEEEEKKVKDSEEEERKAKDGEDPEQKKIEGALKDEAPEGEEEKAAKAKDSAYLADSFQETIALAEIIVPGITVPTFDNALKPVKTYDAICLLRRRALDIAYVSSESRALIDEVLGNRTFDSKRMTCDAVRSLFRSVGALKKIANNKNTLLGRGTDPQALIGVSGGLGVRGKIKTVADLNRFHDEHFKSKSAH